MSAAALLDGRLPGHDLVLGVHHSLEDGRKEKEIDEIGVELRAAALEQHLARDVERLGIAISASVREGVEGVGDSDDTGRERNTAPLESARIPFSIPPLVVCEHAVGEIGIETRQRCEDVGADGRVRGDGSAILGAEWLIVADDVDEGLVDLPDIVEEGDTFDALALVLRELSRFTEDERVRGDAAYVRARLGIVGVDGVEQRLERCRGEPLGDAPGLLTTNEDDRSRRGGRAGAGKGVTGESHVREGGKTRARVAFGGAGRCEGRKNETPRCGCSGAFLMRCRRRPTLPRPLGRSTIGAVGLNDRVRDGNGCGPYALVASEERVDL